MIKITFVGDIFPGEEDFFSGFGIKSKFESGSVDKWRHNLHEITSQSDYVVGNLESPLIEEAHKHKASFYGSPKFAYFLKSCGINILNIANNHILEHGQQGYIQTKKILCDAQIDIIGDNNSILIIEKEHVKIGIAGFNDIETGTHEKDDCFYKLSEKNLEYALHQMTLNNVDVKIFCFHWGNEYIHKPSPMQREIAYRWIDNGINLIVGHHPHAIQPYEKYKEGHIFYSLGNFCFDNPFQSRQFSKGMGITITIDAIAKTIQYVTLFGVNLKHKELVKKVLPSEFDYHFQKIQKQYSLAKGNSRYHEMYTKELKIRHIIERLLMKLSLFKLFFNINPVERRLLIKNLKQFYCK